MEIIIKDLKNVPKTSRVIIEQLAGKNKIASGYYTHLKKSARRYVILKDGIYVMKVADTDHKFYYLEFLEDLRPRRKGNGMSIDPSTQGLPHNVVYIRNGELHNSPTSNKKYVEDLSLGHDYKSPWEDGGRIEHSPHESNW
ncbi:MAG TPA: hypothetical protein VMC41_03900 [Candidatus Nanoarchaeia archaeon]|nr:hypothetical protein [Candidatus Nanoarchaeia archaeon]